MSPTWTPPEPAGRSWPGAELRAQAVGLTDRDMVVLGWLATLHVVRTDQVVRLCFVGSARTATAAKRSGLRCLTRLAELGLVERLERRVGGRSGGSMAFCWRLSAQGHRTVDPSRPSWRQREPSLSRLGHVLDVAELVVRLHNQAAAEAIDVVEVQGEPDCWRNYDDARQRNRVLKPDLRVTLGTARWEAHWFVEVDRGTEHGPVIERKLRAYVDAWRHGTEQAASGVFPGVLWSVPDPKRARTIERIWQAMPTVPTGMCHTAIQDRAVSVMVATLRHQPPS